jgi:hypothetical protein
MTPDSESGPVKAAPHTTWYSSLGAEDNTPSGGVVTTDDIVRWAA